MTALPALPSDDALVVDTETTLATPTPAQPLEVIEVGWLHLDGHTGYQERFRPQMMPTLGATATHHILPIELTEYLAPAAHAGQRVPPVRYWIGHNIDFDWRALGSPPVKRICTLALSRRLWPEFDSHSLTAMTYFTQGVSPTARELLRSAHSALADCRLTLRLFNVIKAELRVHDLEGLWELSEEARIPRVMTFGKFKGEPISAVDRGYASWYARQPDTDPYVLMAFKREGLLR